MTISEVEQFFGLPAHSREFDSYLSARGMLHRPRYDGTPIDAIRDYKGGITLVFGTSWSYEEHHGPLTEEGDMVFESLQVYSEHNDSGFSRYPGALPYGLTFESTLQEALAIFGKPAVQHPSDLNRVYGWYDYFGKTVSICFLPEGKGISFFDLERKKKLPPRGSYLG